LALSPADQFQPGRSLSAESLQACQSAEDSGLFNGFRVLKDFEIIRVAPFSVAAFSLPEEALTYSPPASALVNRFPNGDCERLIYSNVELDAKELGQLRRLQELAASRNLVFLPSVTLMAPRLLSDTRGDCELALERMLVAQVWRQEEFKDGPMLDSTLAEDLRYGVVYFGGRDACLRPALVVRPGRAPPELCNEAGTARLLRVLVFCMEYFLKYMAVPGRIESLSVILDLKGLSLGQIPLKSLLEMKKVMSQQYVGVVARFFICNMPFMLRAISGVVQTAMTERQRQKIVFIRDFSELSSSFALHQLEKDLGGTLPVASQCFPFPLAPGPFAAGHRGGKNPNAVPNVHEVLTRAGALGRLWDPSRSTEENTRLEFDPKARDTLIRLGLEPPQRPNAKQVAPTAAVPTKPPSAIRAADGQGNTSAAAATEKLAPEGGRPLKADSGHGGPSKTTAVAKAAAPDASMPAVATAQRTTPPKAPQGVGPALTAAAEAAAAAAPGEQVVTPAANRVACRVSSGSRTYAYVAQQAVDPPQAANPAQEDEPQMDASKGVKHGDLVRDFREGLSQPKLLPEDIDLQGDEIESDRWGFCTCRCKAPSQDPSKARSELLRRSA